MKMKLEKCEINVATQQNIYLIKFNNRNTRKRLEICSKLTIKTPEDVIDVVLVSLLLTLNLFYTFLVFLLFTLSK